MFNAAVNVLCINDLFTSPTLDSVKQAPMNAKTARLYNAVQARRKMAAPPTPTQVAGTLNISVQRLHNWNTRGPSAQALLELQELSGVNAAWVTTGQGPMFITSEPLTAREPTPPGTLLLTHSETDLLLAYRSLPPSQMKQFRESVLSAACAWNADLNAVMTRNGVRGVASDARVASTLPPRPDGTQPDTAPGSLADAPAPPSARK